MALERCTVRHVQIGPRQLWVPGEGRFTRASTPVFLEAIYRRLLAHSNLRCLPTLVVLEDAGSGGFYVNGIIAMGLRDLERIADQISRYFPDANDDEAQWMERFAREQLITPQDRLIAAATNLLAHELGHAWGAQWQTSQFGVREEIQADEHAGHVAGELCTRSVLDEAFFHHIGCTAPVGCTHPSPDRRVQAYRMGRSRSRVMCASPLSAR